MRRVAQLLAAALALHQPASGAEPPEPVRPVQLFEDLGLLGTWSPDCQQNPSPANPRVTWHKYNGTLMHTVTIDGIHNLVVDEVGLAEVIDTGTITLEIMREQQPYVTVTVQLREGRMHTLRSIGPDGRVNVDDEIEAATGQPALTDEKCAAGFQ